MKYTLLLLLLLPLMMCSEKDSAEKVDTKPSATKKSMVKVTLGMDVAKDWARNGDQVIEIETPISLQNLIVELKIDPKSLGDFYRVGKDAHFVFMLERGNKRDWLCRIEKENGFRPYENRLIHFKNGDKLAIVQLSR